MTDLVLRAEKEIKRCEENRTGNRHIVTLAHELLQEVLTLRAENHSLKTSGAIFPPAVITRDTMVEDER